MKTFALATAAIGLAVTAAPAFAGEGPVRTTEISTAGLDLTTPEGQAMLDKRINKAAREVCGMNEPNTGSRIAARASKQSCYNKARASAKRQVAVMAEEGQRGG